MRPWAIRGLLATGIWAALSQAPPVLTGTVTDADGGPLADVEVAQFWLAGSGDPAGFRAYGATKSDPQGGFALKVSREHYPETLFAMDSTRQRGTVVVIPDAAATRHLTLRLGRLHTVHYRFHGVGLTDLSHSRVILKPVSGPMFSQLAGAMEGAISLPPGAYALGIAVPDGNQTEVHFEVSDRDIALSAITLPANIARYYGA